MQRVDFNNLFVNRHHPTGTLYLRKEMPFGDYHITELMQYTGLKDKQGTEIYEGDIVQIKDHAFEGSMKIDGNYEVGYNEYMELCCGSWLLHRQLPYVTVVGNKFENPELLNK
ncbi:YopX family protein [Alkalihalobacillus clausii]|nr:YopX family protein [Shouchella clausii]